MGGILDFAPQALPGPFHFRLEAHRTACPAEGQQRLLIVFSAPRGGR
jgi:hypothetical protein